MSSSLKAFANSLGIKRATSKASRQLPDSDNTTDSDTNPKMPSFSPGKLLSIRARDSLAEHAIPYAEIPPADSLPDTDHFKFSTPDASILAPDDDEGGGDPGTIRLGPAAVRSTIRLVSHPAMPKRTGQDAAYMSPPRLPVVQTDFDLVAGTPGTVRTLNVWPASPRSVGEGSLYPKLPLDDGDDNDDAMPGAMGASNAMATPAKTPARSLASPSKGKWTGKSTPGPVDEQDMFSPSKPTAPTAAKVEAAPTPARALPRSAPFLFGSPLPRRPTTSTTTATATVSVSKHKGINNDPFAEDPGTDADAGGGVSNAAFDGVAKSVLEEMHRRIAAANASHHNAITPTVASLPAQPVFSFAPPAAPAGEERFSKAHAAEFNKMDSITSHYAARRPPKRKSDALGHGHAGRPSVGQRRRSSAAGARVISAGARRKMGVPGGFGADDDDLSDDEQREEAGNGGKAREENEEEEDAGARRSSKRIRITEGWDVHRAGQRVSLAPPLPPAEEEKKVKGREAVKRELDAAKARRRSSRGRPSIGAQPAKAKSRFGFFGAAKSLVRNVWNMGGGSSKAKPIASAPANPPPPPSSIPVPKAAQAAPADKGKKGEKGKAEAVPAAPRASSSAPNARKTSVSQPNKLLKPPPSAADAKNAGTISSTKSTGLRSRSPIPSFSPPPAPSGTVKSTMTAASRPSSMAGTARSRVSSTGTGGGTAASRQSSRTSATSSMGTRSSVTSGTTVVSSMGTRRSTSSTHTLASTSSKPEVKSPETKDQPSLRKRTSSLLAPTASSLAKTNATARQSTTGRISGLPPVAEAFKPKRTSAAQAASSSRAAVMSPRSSSQQPQSRGQSPLSPRPTRIFSQPLTNFGSSPPRSGSESPASPAYGHPSLTAAAATIMSSPSKIPRPAVLPPKPKQLIARKPRISRSKVIAKLGAQRAAAAQGGASALGSPSGAGAGTRTRSSMGARRSFGGVKAGRASAGAEVMRSAVKKRARQSEYIRRKSRANENESVAGDD
ncbi:hypothetical protein GSI_08812 [Ganoderma sinense ZZ0214-1]|uniref:Uncharacterized protein n=1 Tax=Ganoderma sinense ZZ0214-1 TaxID=1077348 RepID=A0A2G8S5E6_9APHY|nr:hypothetical protein GSI_08812 [Ganoderma sinense ZZ0214-1]